MALRPEPAGEPRPEQAAALALAREGRARQAVQELAALAPSLVSDSDRRRIATLLAQVARIAEDRGDTDSALGAVEQAAMLVDWADLHCLRGRLLALRGRRAEARQSLDRALAINPRYRAAAVERALLDAREGRIAQAMEALRGLATNDELTETRAFEQGLEHLGHADFDDAGALLRRALHAGDAWLEERLHAFQELSGRGELGAALQALRDAVAERPNYPDLHLLLGVHELQRGSVDDAVESLSQALELNPDLHAARVAFAEALEALGQTPQALEQLELVLAEQPAHDEARALHQRLSGRRRVSRTSA